MLAVPTKGVRVVTNAQAVGSAANIGVQIPEGGSANTYGATTQILAAASNVVDSWAIHVAIYGAGASAAASETCVDILAGDATEALLIPGLLAGGAYGGGVRSWWFPLSIPAGTRLSARVSTARTAITDISVAVWLYGGGPAPFRTGRKVTAYGSKANNSRGVAVTPAASGGAASATEIVASTTEDHFYLLPSYQVSTDTTITPAGNTSIGIGLGAATEERVGTWLFPKDTNEVQIGPVPCWGAWRDVPSGTRLTLLASNSGANDAAQDALILAV